MSEYQQVILEIYKAFNSRNIDRVLSVMDLDVHWPNGWEGGSVTGHSELRDYWTRQWKELDPLVIPLSIEERKDGRIEVGVHQTVKDLHGLILFDGMVKHIYSFEGGKINSMEIDKS